MSCARVTSMSCARVTEMLFIDRSSEDVATHMCVCTYISHIVDTNVYC